jgi:hypothetical protein
VSGRAPLRAAVAVGLVAGSTLGLARWTAVYGALLLVLPALLVRLDYSFDRLEVDLGFSVTLALAALLAALAARAALGRWPGEPRPAPSQPEREATSGVA